MDIRLVVPGVDDRVRQPSALQRADQRLVVDDLSPGRVDEDRPRFDRFEKEAEAIRSVG